MWKSRHAIAPFLASVVLWMAGAAVQGQTGSVNPTAAQSAELETYVPPQVTFLDEPVVDLRRWLPAVGQQRMNDCTAWAIAYAAKSYAEARDQGWRPDHPSRIFSPTYVYNQINRGKDDGSTFVDAIVMMREQGAATLATAPYLAKDFTRAPSERARREAQAYPIHDGKLVADRMSIRLALQRRQVVVFGANVNPLFLSGRFEKYTPAMFERDHTQRKPNQPHGKHAMVIAGYDDSRGAFLVQNSWGTRWSQRGYCWVAYELFDQIQLQDTDEQGKPVFCNWAVTLVDVEEPVEIGSDGLPRPLPLDLSKLRVEGFSDFLRFEPELKKFVYGFSVDLRGQREALDQVKHVTWQWTDPLGKQREHKATDSKALFGIRSGTTLNPLPVVAQVHFKDGSTTMLEHEVQGPTPLADDFREAAVVFDHGFYDMENDQTPVYQWRAQLDYPLNERDDIVKVVWNFGKMGSKDEPTLTYEGKFMGVIADHRPFGYATEPDTINVEITYADGGVKRLQHKAVLDAPIVRDISIDFEARKMARDHEGLMHHAVVLKLQRPWKLDTQIKRVTYRVDAHVSTDPMISVASTEGFPVTVAAKRDFRVRATVEFNDGRKQELERWIELGPDTGYPDPNRVELLAYDHYRGSLISGPFWSATFFLVGDLARLDDIQRVTLTYPEEGRRTEEVIEGDQLRFELNARYLMRVIETREPVEVTANVVFKDGAESQLRLRKELTDPINDALGIEISMSDEPSFYFNAEHQKVHLFDATLIGPMVILSQIVEVEWFHQAGGEQLRTRLTDGVMGMPQAYTLGSVATEAFNLNARIRFHDGFEQWLTVPVRPGVSGRYRPKFSLRTKEKFYGYDATIRSPRWTTVCQVVGEASLLEKIEHVQYVYRPVDTRPLLAPRLRKKNAPDWFRLGSPFNVTAMVQLDDGEEVILTGRLRTEAPRSAAPLEMRHDPLVSFDVPGGLVHWVRVGGWDAFTEEIRSVRYEAGTFSEELTFEPDESVYSGVVIPYGVSDTVKARVELHDDRVFELEHPLTEMDRRKFSWTWEQGAYWGDGRWAVETRMDAPLTVLSLIKQRAWFALDGVDASFEDLPSWPIQRKRVLLEPGEYAVQPPEIKAAARGEVRKLDAGSIVVEDRTPERIEALQLTVNRSPLHGPDGESEEWIMRLRGPGRDMTQVIGVRYHWSHDDAPRQTVVERRWGELYDGFEMRIYSASAPVVRASVYMRDGKVIELSTVDNLVPQVKPEQQGGR